MNSRVMQVFYDNQCYPFKDSQRVIRYPIVGNSFNGANNTTQIRFYVRDIGGVNNVTWVAISKLPNGQIGNQVLNEIHLDSELGEYYVVLNLSSYYTQLKGDVYISLNGYQGGIQVEEDSGTGIYTITGTPIIEATGSIKLAINYSPILPLGQHFAVDDLQQVLGALSDKANVVNTVQVIATLAGADLTGYDDGQLFYVINQEQYYKKIATSPYYEVVENGSGLLGSKNALIRYVVTFVSTTLLDLFNLIGFKAAIISSGSRNADYLIQFSGFGSTVTYTRALLLTTLQTWEASTTQLPLSNYISDLLSSTYLNGLVTYTGATNDVDLGEHKLTTKDLEIESNDYHLHIFNGNLFITTGSGGIVLSPDTKAYYGEPQNSDEIATTGYVASAIETIKTNSFILVDTDEYPTLNDFLASDGEEGYIYLYPSTNPAEGYLQYIWESNDWLQIGTTQLDLSNYYTKGQTDTLLSQKANDNEVVKLSGNQSVNGVKTFSSSPVVPNPTNNTDVANKYYVDTKVAKSSEHNKVYGTDNSGNQKLFDVDNTVGADGNIVRRASVTSQIMVPLTPTANGHASSKKYVDDSISNAISNVYKIKGSATVAQINAMTNQQVGDVYNVTDSGTIVAGDLQVFTGDNIVWTGSAWDKLGAEIDWSAYDEKFIAAGFFEVQPYNEETGEIIIVYSTELYVMSYDGDTGVMTIEAN